MQKRTPQRIPPSRLFGGLAVLAFVSLIVAAFVFASKLEHLALRSDSLAAVISAVLVDLANSDRQTNALKSLALNPVLTAAAQAKANDMAVKGYFAHTSPEGLNSWHWFKQAGYSFSYAGENLAVDFSDSGDVERAWMNSPSHRANILNGRFTEVGIATAVGFYQGRPTVFAVQMFGAPSRASRVTTLPVRAVTAPSNPTEIAIATTERASTTVLGKTTAEEIPASDALASPTERYAPFWGSLVSSPRSLLRGFYLFIGALTLFMLLVETGFELRRHHTKRFAIAAFLLILMGGLFIAADRLIFTPPTVAGVTV